MEATGLRFILWQDIFVVVDDGTGQPADYEVLDRLVAEQAKKHPQGLGGLAIISAQAKPPPQPVREALNRSLDRAPVKCLCWQVEGTGFQSAMVRAILTGLRVFSSRRYPTKVASTLDEALVWMLPHLAGGRTRLTQAGAAAAFLREQRQSGARPVAAGR